MLPDMLMYKCASEVLVAYLGKKTTRVFIYKVSVGLSIDESIKSRPWLGDRMLIILG